MLIIENFQKTYDSGFHMEIDFLCFDKGIHLIKGKNGSGKSTLLKAIAGIHSFQGDIVLENISQKKQPIPYRKLVNYSEAEPQFPDFLSLDELILFTSTVTPFNPNQVTELKEILGIGEYASQPIASYSSGMLKKTGLMLAFLGNPQLIILDEPFTTIDLDTQKSLQKLILHRLEECSFLITSHLADFEELFDYSSTTSMENGHLIDPHE
ncbi:ABC transporter ATP-binding protein [Algoriphagus halophilus]|uniref:ABC-2 type transport system ATP-binding protein n=1 Tax=Algoriphagus halophilus TaxID=226505 RepID=A0A1N6D5J7_9BACT|nr:ATP-binding cassette domain-containing protein [Algoriphagus halophilus]SIN66013.1 ABC-2 type transport system ATP-binding protein [Algoriphagus halophilus]